MPPLVIKAAEYTCRDNGIVVAGCRCTDAAADECCCGLAKGRGGCAQDGAGEEGAVAVAVACAVDSSGLGMFHELATSACGL